MMQMKEKEDMEWIRTSERLPELWSTVSVKSEHHECEGLLCADGAWADLSGTIYQMGQASKISEG